MGKFTRSVNGYEWILTVTDSCSRRRWVLLLKRKSDAYTAFEKWANAVEALTGSKIHIICCDNGGEFDSGALKLWAE